MRANAFLTVLAAGACLLCSAWAQDDGNIRFRQVSQSVVEQRLRAFSDNDSQREAVLRQMFLEAGCPADKVTEIAVPKSRQPNLQCVLPGSGDDIVIVGAHFDHADEGRGVIDNWSGASMLPSLVEGLAGMPHKRTFWFVAFTGEEDGLLGSDAFARAMTPEAVAHTTAMVNLDSLGLGPTLVWASQSDPTLVTLLNALAHLDKLPLQGMNVNGMGISDEESFIARGICTVMLHSVTPGSAHLLHSTQDNMKSVRWPDYYASVRLILSYVALLGSIDIPPHTCDIRPLEVGRSRGVGPTRRSMVGRRAAQIP